MKTYGPWKRGPLAWLLSTLPGKAACHWLFQGITYMDPTERRFKLALDSVGVACLFPFARRLFRRPTALLVSVAATHTLNGILNGQFVSLLKWHGLVRMTDGELESYLVGLGDRLGGTRGVQGAWAYGSLARGSRTQWSDIDVRVLRRRGLRNGITVCMAVACERTRALLTLAPLDIFVWDSYARASDMRTDEHPIDLLTGHRAGPAP